MTTSVTETTLLSHPDFYTTVRTVAECAERKMPNALPRIIKALQIVLADGVQPSPYVQGGWRVASQSQAEGYEVYDNTCTCPDYQRRQPTDPELCCKHIIAVWMYRRVAQRLALADTPATPAPCVPQAPALPEAPASVNFRVVIQGRECQITLRDTDETRLLDRLETLMQRFPVTR